MQLPRVRRSWWLGAVASGYLVLTLAATWPLATRLDDTLPLGCNRSATVPLVSAWALWWTSDRAEHGFADYWDAPIFYPARGTFAFSEPMPLLGLAAKPLLALGASPALAHNLVLLVALWLNGIVGYALARELGLSRPAALFGGALVLLLPYTHHQIGVLTLVPLFAIEASLLLVLRAARMPTIGHGAAVGAALGASFAMCLQHSLMFAVALVLAVPWLLRRRRLQRRTLYAMLATAFVGLALLTPLALAHHRAIQDNSFERTVERGERGSAGIRTWLRTPYPDLVPAPWIDAASPPDKRSLFPGVLRAGLAVIGVALGWRRVRRTRTRFFVALAVMSICLSTLGNQHVGSASVYETARALVPGLSAIRSVWRAGVIAQISAMMLAAQGLHLLWIMKRSRFVHGTVFALATLALFEQWPPTQRLFDVQQAASYRGLRAVLDAEDASPAMLMLPAPPDQSEQSLELTAELMYATAFLERPWVNGYSSYSPRAYKRLSRSLAKQGNAPELRTLREAGTPWVVLIRQRAPALKLPDSYVRMFEDRDLGIELYRDQAER